mmetsp:Transcript_23597/g.65900  ORF Transcript_23597/g.65900 Transcript_23597/m.65900 type:complete len:203 (+) Transcript_23597:718-1326(+)
MPLPSCRLRAPPRLMQELVHQSRTQPRHGITFGDAWLIVAHCEWLARNRSLRLVAGVVDAGLLRAARCVAPASVHGAIGAVASLQFHDGYGRQLLRVVHDGQRLLQEEVAEECVASAATRQFTGSPRAAPASSRALLYLVVADAADGFVRRRPACLAAAAAAAVVHCHVHDDCATAVMLLCIAWSCSWTWTSFCDAMVMQWW